MVHVPGLHVPAPQGLQQENGGGLHRLPAGGQQGQADADEPPGPCLAATAALFGHIKGEWPHLEKITDPAELAAELDRVRTEYNTVRLHAGIGYEPRWASLRCERSTSPQDVNSA